MDTSRVPADAVVASGVPTMGGRRARDRAAAGWLLVVLGAGSFSFWLGIPVLILWALSKATESSAEHFVLGLLALPTAMITFAPVLMRLDAAYLRVSGRLPENEDRLRPRLGGPLGLLLILSFLISIVALVVWFFFFAENPPRQVI
jgi:hypothetical protein